jgi:hypothetical protein
LNSRDKVRIFDAAKVININRIKKEEFVKTLNYVLIPAVFLLSACASGQYSSSEDGIYFNPGKPYTPAPSPAMTKAKQLNEKTQAVVTARSKDAAAAQKQIDTLYVTDENRTVELDATPDKTYLIVDESDSYARRLRMFEEDAEYTPPTVNINVDAGYRSYYHSPWYWRTSWAWYDYWDPWYHYYPGYYYYRPWYYGGYYGYYYPHYHHYNHYHHHHHDYYYHNNVNYGRRLANTGTVRRVSPDESSNTGAVSTSRRTTSRTQPQIRQVSGNRQSSSGSVASRRQTVSPANSSGVSASSRQSTGANSNTAVTSRRTGTSTSTGTSSTNYTRSSTSRGTSAPTYNNSSTGASSRRSTSTYNSSSSNRSSSNQSSSYNTSRSSSSSRSSSVGSSSSGSSRSSGSSGSSGGSSRRR